MLPFAPPHSARFPARFACGNCRSRRPGAGSGPFGWLTRIPAPECWPPRQHQGLRRRLTPFRTGWNPDPYSYYRGVRVEKLIEQLLQPSLGKVAREIFLDSLADERRQFLKNLVVDLLVCSQPAIVTTATLDKSLDVIGNMADQTPFEFELKIVIIGQWCAPVLLRGRDVAAGHIGDFIDHATVRLFQNHLLQMFEPRGMGRSIVKLVGPQQAKISNDKQFVFHELALGHANPQATPETSPETPSKYPSLGPAFDLRICPSCAPGRGYRMPSPRPARWFQATLTSICLGLVFSLLGR